MSSPPLFGYRRPENEALLCPEHTLTVQLPLRDQKAVRTHSHPSGLAGGPSPTCLASQTDPQPRECPPPCDFCRSVNFEELFSHGFPIKISLQPRPFPTNSPHCQICHAVDAAWVHYEPCRHSACRDCHHHVLRSSSKEGTRRRWNCLVCSQPIVECAPANPFTLDDPRVRQYVRAQQDSSSPEGSEAGPEPKPKPRRVQLCYEYRGKGVSADVWPLFEMIGSAPDPAGHLPYLTMEDILRVHEEQAMSAGLLYCESDMVIYEDDPTWQAHALRFPPPRPVDPAYDFYRLPMQPRLNSNAPDFVPTHRPHLQSESYMSAFDRHPHHHSQSDHHNRQHSLQSLPEVHPNPVAYPPPLIPFQHKKNRRNTGVSELELAAISPLPQRAAGLGRLSDRLSSRTVAGTLQLPTRLKTAFAPLPPRSTRKQFQFPVLKLEGLPHFVRTGDIEAWVAHNSLPAQELQPVSIHIVIDVQNGNFAGEAFVQVVDQRAVDINMANEQMIHGHRIRVTRSSHKELIGRLYEFSTYIDEYTPQKTAQGEIPPEIFWAALAVQTPCQAFRQHPERPYLSLASLIAVWPFAWVDAADVSAMLLKKQYCSAIARACELQERGCPEAEWILHRMRNTAKCSRLFTTSDTAQMEDFCKQSMTSTHVHMNQRTPRNGYLNFIHEFPPLQEMEFVGQLAMAPSRDTSPSHILRAPTMAQIHGDTTDDLRLSQSNSSVSSSVMLPSPDFRPALLEQKLPGEVETASTVEGNLPPPVRPVTPVQVLPEQVESQSMTAAVASPAPRVATIRTPLSSINTNSRASPTWTPVAEEPLTPDTYKPKRRKPRKSPHSVLQDVPELGPHSPTPLGGPIALPQASPTDAHIRSRLNESTDERDAFLQQEAQLQARKLAKQHWAEERQKRSTRREGAPRVSRKRAATFDVFVETQPAKMELKPEPEPERMLDGWGDVIKPKETIKAGLSFAAALKKS